jgi:hypothetical protein
MRLTVHGCVSAFSAGSDPAPGELESGRQRCPQKTNPAGFMKTSDASLLISIADERGIASSPEVGSRCCSRGREALRVRASRAHRMIQLLIHRI